MSHVDEGALHAYLDHAGRPSAEWREVEDHLAACPECRQRLEEARTLRERAAAILATSGPAAVPVPPFDTVVARAGGKASRRVFTVSRLRALGWAASVALAVGVGWMARGALNPLRSPGQSLTAPAPRTAPSDSALPSSAVGARAGMQTAGSEQRAAVDSAFRARTVEEAAERLRRTYVMTDETKPSAEAAAGRQDVELQNAAEPVQPPPEAVPEAAAPQAKLAQDVGAMVAPRRERQVQARAAALEAAPNTAQWIAIDSAQAAGRLGEPLHMVPGVRVLRIEREALEDGRAVRIVQDLDGVSLEILHRTVEFEGQLADRLAADAPGEVDASGATITIVRGSVVLTLRANLTPDSLRSLAARIP